LVNLDDMILFAEVAECGSFTKAGARLGIPKSSISQRVSQLESRLGLRLLNRSTRNVSLTSSGQAYLQHCLRVRSEAVAAELAMTHMREEPVGSLRITCPEVTASYFMPEFLTRFAENFPRVEIELLATNKYLDIIQERIDYAFRVGPAAGQDFIVRDISPIRRSLVAALRYLESRPPILNPDDIASHRCLIHTGHSEWLFSNGAVQTSLHPSRAMESDSMGFLLESSVAGAGIALLPAYVSASFISGGMLVELLPDWRVPPHRMSLIFPKTKNSSKAQIAFRAYAERYDFSRLSGGMIDLGR
jgi:DNA-binding transcriptional LysR family regulator